MRFFQTEYPITKPLATNGKRGRTSNRRFGAATIEMALVAPFILLLVFGSIELTRMMMVRQALTNAAREGCRNACLATTHDDTDAIACVRAALQGVIKNADDDEILRVTCEPGFNELPASGTRITTNVEVFCSDVSWLPPFFCAGLRIRGTSLMVRE